MDYKTSIIQCWLAADRTFSQIIREMTKRAPSLSALAEAIRCYCEQQNPLVRQRGMYAELLQDSLRSADWRAIAEMFVDEMVEAGYLLVKSNDGDIDRFDFLWVEESEAFATGKLRG